tara:strand:- start:49 stop:1068 length:1020 start_codon:yes stop_codon:yes gene_type:complete
VPKKKTLKETIADFRKVYGDLYDYSKVVYKNADTNVVIICPKHGEFKQRPNNHKRGYGCPNCNNAIKRLETEEIVESFRKVHGNIYDYSKLGYKNNKEKVTIICEKHGEFKKRIDMHRKGSGCPLCYAISGSKRCSFLTNEKVISRFQKTHGNRYDYSKIQYENRRTKIIIICKVHGEFMQRSDMHKAGNGCPECGKNQIAEPLFREVLESIISTFGKFEFPNIRPEWLRNPETGRALELDCYNEELAIAFELQGRHHYKPIKAWGGEERFAKVIRRDSHKLTGCGKRRVQLFRIDNRPVSSKPLQIKRQYYENEIKKCLTKLPEEVKLKLLNANNKEI